MCLLIVKIKWIIVKLIKYILKSNYPTILINQLHPSIPNSEHIAPTSELIMMADIIISDYSSLPIEASLLNKPTLFYVFDEEEYEEVRGLNQFYRDIPTFYKVKHIDELVTKIKYNEKK